MTHSIRLAGAAILLGGAIAHPLGAQSLANRINGAPDGLVQFNFAAREGVCGNGRSYISVGSNTWIGTFHGPIGEVTRSDPCVRGPVRVVINRANKEVIDINAYVGPLQATPGATDLGAVPAREAAEYLLSVAQRADGKPGRDAIFPAVIADSATVTPALLEIARNQDRARETRRSAISWLGREIEERGGASPAQIARALGDIARDENDNQSVRQQAMSTLSRLERGDGIPALVEISRSTTDVWLAKQAMSTLAQSGDPRARQYLRQAVQRTDLSDDVRVSAIRGVGREYATSQDAEFLRGLYPKLESQKTKEAVVSSLAEMGGAENSRWLMSIARDEKETIHMRRRAVQLAERAGSPTSDVIALYDRVEDPQMKEALIAALSQNGTKAATDKLLSIARTEPNYQLRRKTISYLGRSEDPRVRDALREIVEKQ